jgi:pyruvate,water dikinase
MNEKERQRTEDKLLWALQERAKELNCLYKVEELLNHTDADEDKAFRGIIEAIPPGWQFPDICVARLIVNGKTFTSEKFEETKWVQTSDIEVQGSFVGRIEIYYLKEVPDFDEGPFLQEERRLINTIAERIGNFLLHNRLREVFNELKEGVEETRKDEWKTAIHLLKETDKNLYHTIARKMMNHLCWSGVKEAEALLFSSAKPGNKKDGYLETDNIPQVKEKLPEIGDEIFRLAEEYLSDDEINDRIQKWIQEDKASYLIKTLENDSTTIPEVADALRRYQHTAPELSELSPPTERVLNVSLIRRFLSDQLNFISKAKDFVEIKDFYQLLQQLIYPAKSQGKIGGKGVGLFTANKILKTSKENESLFKDIRIPKTWYIASDCILEFLHYNNLEEVIEQKYKDLDRVRQEYPSIVQVFKNSAFPPEIVNALSAVLDDLSSSPLIVRSSSLLEDRIGTSFSGKYKSLFVANQGTKQQRLESLLDAIAEVYASVFNTDPIEYRSEKGLLDYNEEMGVLIQEVVGRRVGKYYFPAYAGVAFSNNEFRWSPRIKREDGLIRFVPGLGTRAVDRMSDDYPVLIAPANPGLRASAVPEEIIRYSPKKMDVINLETNSFETVDINEVIRMYGNEYPNITSIVSALEGDHVKDIVALEMEGGDGELVVTFDRLIKNSRFVKLIAAILKTLKEKLMHPVEIEFASDGDDFYLLQCRAQSYSEESRPAPIPKDIPQEKIIFTAHKYVSNGKVPDITHLVYVDPEKYAELPTMQEMKNVGAAVGRLNKILPKRQFILMGPGRWGSKGDIRLGVSVTYSDINNTAVLIEIARKKGNYVPDLSFGTHFFQDLVESSIRYLPLYPDDPGVVFNERFLKMHKNILPDILPGFLHLKDVIKVIDVPDSTGGNTLKVLMNADLDEAAGIISPPSSEVKEDGERREYREVRSEDYWRWRLRMAEKIASELDPEKFGVKAFYVFGSTKNATAGPGSDIDLLIHFTGSESQKLLLTSWLEGWSKCLGEMNFLKTGYKSDELLDVHIITDEDIKNRQSYAAKIGAVTDPAREIPLKKKK